MRKLLGTTLGVAVLALLAVGLAPVAASAGVPRATAATTVVVTVGDTTGLAGPMTMTVAPDAAPAGKVTFKVTNNGTILHEMVVLKLKAGTTYDQLKVNSKNEVSESTTVGEVGNVPKGKTKSVTLKLKKGNYVLVCNIAKHYGLGMRAAFTVN
jgi:uncharacterized cupredoxin-like copper-binding protein